MDKLAELMRAAEIRGVVSAFVDAGLVKVAGQEEFDSLVGSVCARLGDEKYDLKKVASITDALLAEQTGNQEADESQPDAASRQKTAEEGMDKNVALMRNAALGELLQMKVAGKVDDAVFTKTAAELMDKKAFIGAWRAGNLSGAEADALRSHYGLAPDANLALRNIGRSSVGSALGSIPGVVTSALGASRRSPALTLGGLAGSALGSLGGSVLATNKYSKGNAQRVMAEKKASASSVSAPVQKTDLTELLLQKVAGKIDEAAFNKNISELQ